MAIEVSSTERVLHTTGTHRDQTIATAKSPAPTKAASAAVSNEQVTSAVHELQKAVKAGPNPDFSLDYLSGLSVVTVRSNRTGEVVFQLPDARAVELARLLKGGASLSELGMVNFEV